MKKIEFEDAQQKLKDNPRTFFAPHQPELDEIKEDDHVKVCVSGERFWVLVTKVENDTITGYIDNDLVLTGKHGLKYKDIITFEKKNVYNISSNDN